MAWLGLVTFPLMAPSPKAPSYNPAVVPDADGIRETVLVVVVVVLAMAMAVITMAVRGTQCPAVGGVTMGEHRKPAEVDAALRVSGHARSASVQVCKCSAIASAWVSDMARIVDGDVDSIIGVVEIQIGSSLSSLSPSSLPSSGSRPRPRLFRHCLCHSKSSFALFPSQLRLSPHCSGTTMKFFHSRPSQFPPFSH